MPTPYLVPSLAALRAEFNSLAPNRDRSSDGWIGDAAHSSRASDHNPDSKGAVHAIDVDNTGPWPDGLSMERIVQFLLARCRSGQEGRLKYVIYNRRIWSKSNDWVQQAYAGSNPHDHHAHFSGVYTAAAEGNTSSWHLDDLEEPTMTAPTPQQNADAVAAKDIDPSAGTHSLGGGIWTILARSAILNTLPTQLADVRDELDARVQDVDDELDGLGASLALLMALVAEVTNDPAVPEDGGNIWYTTMRQAVKDELDARG